MIQALPITDAEAGLKVIPEKSTYEIRKMALRQDDEDQIRDQVGKFVNGTFFGIMMKAMRKTVPEGGLISGGRGENVFQEFLDHEITSKLSERGGGPLIEAAVRQLRGIREYTQKMPRRHEDPAILKSDKPTIEIAR